MVPLDAWFTILRKEPFAEHLIKVRRADLDAVSSKAANDRCQPEVDLGLERPMTGQRGQSVVQDTSRNGGFGI